MKRFFSLILIATFFSCNNGNEGIDLSYEDSARIKDSTLLVDSIDNVATEQAIDTILPLATDTTQSN